MADDTSAGAMPAAPGATPNTPATGPIDTPPPAGATPDDIPGLGDAGKAAIQRERELRSEAEKREKALAKRVQAFEDADKTESQKAQDRIAALEQELTTERGARRTAAVQIAALSAARKIGFTDPDLAVRLIAPGEVEFADDGSPKNVERLLDAIAKQYPRLVARTTDYGGGPRGSAPDAGGDMNAAIRRAAGRA